MPTNHMGEKHITLREYLLKKTHVHEFCVFRESGWYKGCTWIDSEDTFIHSLDKRMLDMEVVGIEYDTISVWNMLDTAQRIPCTWIDIK